MLNLDLPTDDAPPGAAVETRPKQVEARLERLPYGSPTEAARQITAMLAAMNRTRIDDAERYRTLIQLHPAIARIAASLEPQIGSAGIPPTQTAWLAGAQLRDLWLELGYGYKRVLLGLIGRRSGFRGSQPFVDVTTLLLIALRNLQYACHQTYAPLPPGLWREMHHLHWFAREADFAEKPAALDATSPSLVYRQALLTALADPHHLDPVAQLHARRYVERFAALAELSPGDASQESQETMRFFILSDADHATSQPLAGPTSGALWLNTERLCNHLQATEARLASGDPPRVLGLPEGMHGETGEALLQRLQRCWQQKTPRKFRRTRHRATDLQLVAGVSAVHRVLLDQGGDTAPAPAASTTIGMPAPTGRTSAWRLINDSAGGVALAGSPDLPHSLNIGEPLALQEGAAGGWSLGVIRWIRMRDSREVEMGVERLSPRVEPVWIRPVRRRQLERPQPALLLRGMPAQQREDCLLLPPHVYRSARDVELLHDQQLDCVTFGPRLERSASYDLVEFTRFQ